MTWIWSFLSTSASSPAIRRSASLPKISARQPRRRPRRACRRRGGRSSSVAATRRWATRWRRSAGAAARAEDRRPRPAPAAARARARAAAIRRPGSPWRGRWRRARLALLALDEALAKAARGAEVTDRGGGMRGDLQHLLVPQDALARHVHALRLALAPRRQFAQDDDLARGGVARLQAPPRLVRLDDVDRGIAQDRHLVGDPRFAAGTDQAVAQLLVDHPQMRHVGQRVVQLLLGQGPAAPVGEAAGLVDLGFGHARGQRVVGDLLAEAADHRRHLGVEQRLGQVAHQLEEDLEILPGGVEDLQHGRIVEQDEERREVDALGQRVDRGGFFRPADLHQAELRPVGTLPHELRVDGDELRGRQTLTERGQFGRCRYHLHVREVV